jgi:hypothetical protein
MIRSRLRIAATLLIALVASLGWWTVAATPAGARAAATTRLTVTLGDLRVALTVPSGWHVSHTAPTPQCGCGGDYNPVCIVVTGDYGRNPNNCELMVGGNVSEQLPDEPVPGYRLPRCDSWTTTFEAHTWVGDRRGEYRIFLDRCHDRMSEQWTSLTTPAVSIWHPFSWGWDDTVAAGVAGSIQLSGTSIEQGRTTELGFVRNLVMRDGRAYVTIDRAVLSLSGHAMNRNPQTYVYRLAYRSRRFTGCPHFIGNCNTAQLVAQFRKGAHPADGSRPLIGRLVELRKSGRWWLNDANRWVFTSRGDPGHCGCH